MADDDFRCWHGTNVKPDASGWVHIGSGTRCDDPAPMRKPAGGWGKRS